MDGTITEYAVPTPGSAPNLLGAGVDGQMWFTELDSSRIASIGTGVGPLVTASVTGKARVGSTLICRTVNAADWSVASTSRVWLRNSRVIHGATGRSYVVRGKDSGKNISCRAGVTFSPALNQMGARAKSIRID